MDRPENIDRALLGLCAAIWLAVIGVSVAATVALVGFGSGQASQPQPDADTPWVLYVVIAISAVVILASIPLLLRARRASLQEPPARRPAAGPRAEPPEPTWHAASEPATEKPTVEPATEKLRVFGTMSERPVHDRTGGRRPEARLRFLTEFEDRVWLRFITSMAAVLGVATLAVAIAAYLFADHSDGMAWAALVVAGIITVAMPAVPWWYLRQLHAGSIG